MSAVGLHCSSGLVGELDASRSITVSFAHEFMLELWRAWVFPVLEKQQAI